MKDFLRFDSVNIGTLKSINANEAKKAMIRARRQQNKEAAAN